jgi:hypothetical protein
MTSAQFITPKILLKYRIAEIMHRDDGIMIILFHPNESYPGICAKVRYIESTSGLLPAFSAFSVLKESKLTGTAHEGLEFEILSILENMLKCTFAKNAMMPIIMS